MRSVIRCVIKLYKYLISPFIPSSCRFYPSCSQYALQALTQYRVSKSLWLICCRLLRCHPWAQGGYDPVPNKEKP
ncbi:MAG: membrane protein insertion efficiency factor YidD [Legionellaceae bacterium]|nr:membrane protein insertion efficiency factor YidD [Legionellaceae bacterium]